MKKLLLAALAASLFVGHLADAARADFSGPTAVPAVTPAASDLVPSRHLSNLIGKTSAKICIIGDSTGTAGPTLGNAVDPSQNTWGFLQEKLKADNPQITSWTFDNWAIGATNESMPLSTGTTLQGGGTVLPSWFVTLGNTWLSYVQADNCDVLFWMFGTNQANSGETSGTSAAAYIRQNFENINGWTPVPNVVIITTKNANPATDASGDDAVLSQHKAQAAFHRTFARSNAAGYTSFPNVSALGFGLIDLGRYFTANVEGKDVDAQFLQARPDCLINGFSVTNNSVIGSGASTVCTTRDGDYRLTFVLPAEGGTTIGGAACTALKISGGPFIGDFVHLNIAGNGALVPRRVLDGNTGSAPTQIGSLVSTTNAADVTITVTLTGKRAQVIINGTTALDTDAPRFVTGVAGGTPINLVCQTAPNISLTANITEFFEGIATPTPQPLSYQSAFGFAATCTSSNTGCQGGNNQNHISGSTQEYDRRVIKAMNFAVPFGSASTYNVGTSGATIPLLNGTNTWGGVQTFPAGDIVLGTAVNGDIGTFNASHALQDSGTLLSALATLASPTFTGTVTLPDGSTSASGTLTIATAMAMGGHGMTAAGALIGQATSGPEFFGSSTASSTVPTFAPNRASTTTGIGAQASGNMSLIAGGAEQARVVSGAMDIITALAGDSNGHVLISATAPTISSGFGTSPTIVANNGTAGFEINVGTGGSATSGVIGLPSATNGWAVKCEDITTNSSTVFMTKQTATTATTATVGNFNTSAAAAAWAASDKLWCQAHAL